MSKEKEKCSVCGKELEQGEIIGRDVKGSPCHLQCRIRKIWRKKE